jgi:hypothetical protein
MPYLCHLIWQQTSHNPEVAGSNPAPATGKAPETRPFCFLSRDRAFELLPNFCPKLAQDRQTPVRREAVDGAESPASLRQPLPRARPLGDQAHALVALYRSYNY